MINGLVTLYTRDMDNKHVVRFSDMLKNKTVKSGEKIGRFRDERFNVVQEPTRTDIP